MSYHSGLENQVSDWLLLFDDLKKRTVVFYPVLILIFLDLGICRYLEIVGCYPLAVGSYRTKYQN